MITREEVVKLLEYDAATGVYRYEARTVWCVSIQISGKWERIKCYESLDDAVVARKEFEKSYGPPPIYRFESFYDVVATRKKAEKELGYYRPHGSERPL